MRIIKIIKTLLFVTLPTLLVLFIIIELFFKFIIPASERPDGFFYEDEKMYSFSGEKITGLNTFGRFAEIKAKWHINNMHWNYPIDYYPAKDKPLIAVIGDSYIEAFQVDADKNYPYLLKEKVLPEYEVYAFGKSGAPLSQYLHISRYLNKHLKPDILIFNIVHNDFDESIDKRFPDRHHFLKLSYNEQDDTFTEIIPTPNLTTAQYKTWKRILYKSSLFRYLYFNIDIVNIRKQIINRKNNNQFEGNIIPEELQQHKNLIIKATDYLVKKIMDENKDKRIIFIMDAPRDSIYNNTLENSEIWWLHNLMRETCQKYNAEFIDLTESMKQDFTVKGQKFNSDLDGHWDEYGHEFVTKILYDYLIN